MTERNPALWIQARSDHTAEHDRSFPYGLLGGRSGVFTPNDLTVTQNGTPNMSVNVASGRASIAGSESTMQGSYVVLNDATKNLTIAAADPTNPRRDLIIAKVQDAAYSGATNAWSLAVVTGTPAASPSDPATPANSVVLARVAVAALATSIVTANITDLRPRLAAAGGVITCTSTTRPSSPWQGMTIYETDTRKVLEYQTATTTWTPPWNSPWGYVGAVTGTAQTGIGASVTDLTGLSVSYTGYANRRLLLQLIVPCFNSTSVGSLYIADSATAILQSGFALPNAVNVFTQMLTTHFTTTGTSHTFKGRASVTGGTLSTYDTGSLKPQLIVTDIGPAGAPA